MNTVVVEDKCTVKLWSTELVSSVNTEKRENSGMSAADAVAWENNLKLFSSQDATHATDQERNIIGLRGFLIRSTSERSPAKSAGAAEKLTKFQATYLMAACLP